MSCRVRYKVLQDEIQGPRSCMQDEIQGPAG
jgi:hypothetical protein